MGLSTLHSCSFWMLFKTISSYQWQTWNTKQLRYKPPNCKQLPLKRACVLSSVIFLPLLLPSSKKHWRETYPINPDPGTSKLPPNLRWHVWLQLWASSSRQTRSLFSIPVWISLTLVMGYLWIHSRPHLYLSEPSQTITFSSFKRTHLWIPQKLFTFSGPEQMQLLFYFLKFLNEVSVGCRSLHLLLLILKPIIMWICETDM